MENQNIPVGDLTLLLSRAIFLVNRGENQVDATQDLFRALTRLHNPVAREGSEAPQAGRVAVIEPNEDGTLPQDEPRVEVPHEMHPVVEPEEETEEETEEHEEQEEEEEEGNQNIQEPPGPVHAANQPVGFGFGRNNTYTSSSGRVHDLSRPPPGRCFNCDGNHWRIHCPYAQGNNTLEVGALFA